MIHRKSIVVSNNFRALFVNDFKSFLTFGFDIKEIKGFGAENIPNPELFKLDGGGSK